MIEFVIAMAGFPIFLMLLIIANELTRIRKIMEKK